MSLTGRYSTGRSGEVRIGTNYSTADDLYKVRNWSFTLEREVIDVTTLRDTHRHSIPSYLTGSGSATVLWYLKNNETRSNLNKLANELHDASNDGNDTYTLCGFLLTGGKNNDGFQFNGWLTNFTLTCATGEIVTGEIQFRSSGDILVI